MNRIYIMQNYGKFVEARFHELEHESKMRLLKTHFHTSERQGNEASNIRQKRERKEGLALRGRDKSSRKAMALSTRCMEGAMAFLDEFSYACPSRLGLPYFFLFSRVPCRSEVWEWLLRSRIFDSCSSSWD